MKTFDQSIALNHKHPSPKVLHETDLEKSVMYSPLPSDKVLRVRDRSKWWSVDIGWEVGTISEDTRDSIQRSIFHNIYLSIYNEKDP